MPTDGDNVEAQSFVDRAVDGGGSDVDAESTSASIPGGETGAFVYETPVFLVHRHAGQLE